jgi:hypothetical protein
MLGTRPIVRKIERISIHKPHLIDISEAITADIKLGDIKPTGFCL